ncbi:MAG: peptide chain release factor 2 [Oscillospiraceae bacterium]|nr:peptide chain release factor 2 [Oscillospiraceae bacterium]
MARIEFDEYKVRLGDLEPKLKALGESLGLEAAREELERLHAMAASEGFWNDAANSQKVTKQTRLLENKISSYEKMCADREDLLVLCEMAVEEDDDSLLPELEEGYAALEKEMEEARLETLLTGEYDANNALMSFHAGAGGTEAQDWCQMLYRMYTRWAERHGFTYKIMDYLEGDEAGLKSADILIEGPNAYGFLKGENGVHRLVRVSPFDSNARRQTSFAAIEVIPEIDDDANDVEIRPEDIEMQVYRSSGAGGQHINKTSSAVRLIHKPTGIVVSCQTERSQFQNRDNCMKMLRSKLVEIKEREHLDKISDIKGVQQKIEWGSQIRNYVFMPYTLVKDTRTGCETSNVNGVMDGDLDPFINSYLTCAATGNWVQK